MTVHWETVNYGHEWDGFVRERGSIFHSWKWREVICATGLKPQYMAAKTEDAMIIGVCPFFLVKIKGPFYALESLPDSDLSGPVFKENERDSETLLTSLAKSVPQSATRVVTSLRLRVHDERLVRTLIGLGHPCYAGSGYFFLDLDGFPPKKIWEITFRRDERRKILQLDQMRVETQVCTSSSDIHDFYHLYQETMRRRNYRIHDEIFFQNIRLAFPEEFKLLRISVSGKTIAAITFLADRLRRTLHLQHVAYEIMKNRSPNFYAYWHAIQWAQEHDYNIINFGNGSSNPSSNNYRFKKQFGGEFVTRYTFSIQLHKRLYKVGKRITQWL